MIKIIKKMIPTKIKLFIWQIIPRSKKSIFSIFAILKKITVARPDPKLPNYYLFINRFDQQSTIVDVGCGFDADFSMYMIDTYNLKAIGIDPTQKHKESLENLVKKNNDKFSYKPLAISEKDGQITFNESIRSTSGSILDEHINVSGKETQKYSVESVSLKNLPKRLGLNKIDYIKLDIEGAEYELIDSLNKEDLTKYNQIFIEFHHHALPQYSKADTIKMVRKIESLGFKSFTLDNHDFLFYRQK